MDADTLRLVLFILGCFVILGIYLWDRYKRGDGPQLRIRLDKKRTPWNRVGPELSNSELRSMEREVEQDNILLDPLELPEDHRGARREPPPTKNQSRGKVRSTQKIQRPTPPTTPQIPEKILQLFVQARKGYFTGEEIFLAARNVGLRHGEMEIFHYYDPESSESEAIFSVASMVNPGVIPVKGMADFTTPGLVLFARLPGAKDGIKVLQDMLNTVAGLAERLNGEVLDDSHLPLRPEQLERLRQEIIEHREQLP